jgi:hypothetical protein
MTVKNAVITDYVQRGLNSKFNHGGMVNGKYISNINDIPGNWGWQPDSLVNNEGTG